MWQRCCSSHVGMFADATVQSTSLWHGGAAGHGQSAAAHLAGGCVQAEPP